MCMYIRKGTILQLLDSTELVIEHFECCIYMHMCNVIFNVLLIDFSISYLNIYYIIYNIVDFLY